MYTKIIGGTVRSYGDLHISDTYKGRHKDYLLLCTTVLSKIEREIKEKKPSAVIFTGDLVGVLERNIKNREILSQICNYFQRLNKMTEVFVVRGNHDFGDYPEFQFLHDLGLFKTSRDCIPEGNDENGVGYIDYFVDDTEEIPSCRFHLVDYGKEKHELCYPISDDTPNIVFAHNNFTISGVTNWYQEHDGIELARIEAWRKVDLVVAGHIHVPSPSLVSTYMLGTDHACSLFYLGNPTMVTKDKNMYEKVWSMNFKPKGKDVSFDAEEFELPPLDEVFYPDEFVEDLTEEEIQEKVRSENLKSVLDEIINCRIDSADLEAQIKNMPQVSPEAKEMALKYYQLGVSTSVNAK